HVVEEARDQNHHQMDDDEEHDQRRGDEMERARALPSVEEIDDEGEAGIDARRHGKPGEHDERQDDEDEAEIGELLQHIVVTAVIEAEEGMIDDRPADAAQLRPARDEVAPDMAAEEARDEIDEAVDDEEPGEEEMPAPAGREILIAGDRHGAREGAARELA